MKYCANCGSKLADNMRFCPECGFDQRIYRPDAGQATGDNAGASPSYDQGPSRDPGPAYGTGPSYDRGPSRGPEASYDRGPSRGPEPAYDRGPAYERGPSRGPESGFDRQPRYRGVQSWDYPFRSRSIVFAVIVSIVTFGIYYLYWMYDLVKSWNYISEVQGRRRGMSAGLVVVLAIVTFGIFTIYYWYRISRQISELDDRNGEPLEDHSIVCLLFALFGLGLVSAAIVQNTLNFYLDYEL